MSGCKNQPPLDIWSELVANTSMSSHAKAVATERVARMATRLRSRVWRLGWCYSIGKAAVTVGALLMPALTGLDRQRAQPDVIFWCIWVLGVTTGASNAFIALFGIDRSYFSSKDQLALLEAEAWAFIALSGHYRGSSHQELFAQFMEATERILDKAMRRTISKDQTSLTAREKEGGEDLNAPPPAYRTTIMTRPQLLTFEKSPSPGTLTRAATS